MHGRRNTTQMRDRAPHAQRRGSVLILVVSVLVLLAISAAVYVGVGQQERRAASASEMKSHRDAVSAKVVDYLGQIMVRDLFGNDAQALFPFEDRIAAMGFGNFAVGERWDYPYTRPDAATFNVLADPWLADLEPADTDGDGFADSWRHISNVHPQGKFVSFDGFFRGGRSLQSSGFYNDLFISGGNSRPYDLDTYTGEVGTPFRYTDQISQQVVNDADRGVVTWADRQVGADTDGDGRIDARWTELADVYGLPKEMRIFVATRIVDASAMLNVNANFELGATAPNDTSSRIGFGRTPADVDLYTAFLDAYGLLQGGTGLPDENVFINGTNPARLGFKEHINRTGIQDVILGPGQPYSRANRSTRVQRETFWNSFARNPYRPAGNFAPYGVADEMELRTYMFAINDRATSRLEQSFDGLNLDPGNPNTWYSPLRNRYFSRERVDYSQGTPTIPVIRDDFRHLLTTYNGSMPIRPWNRGYSASDSPAGVINLNSLLASNTETVPQTLTGGFMWALAPFATDIGNANGSDSGFNLYGSPVVWRPTGSNEELHYGDGDAGYALLKSAVLAMNALDFYDNNNIPSIRTLVFGRNYTGTDREDREIIGSFEHGRVPNAMPGPNGDQRDATITVIGLERQPFLREVCAVNVYGNLDDNDFWNYEDPGEGDRREWMVRVLAIEIGNPWPNPISTSGYRLKFGNDPMNVWSIPGFTIPAGESAVVYVANGDPLQLNGLPEWESIINGRSSQQVRRIGDNSTHLEFSGTGGEFDEVTLWRNSTYGVPGNPVDLMVDRIRPATSNNDFPNIIPLSGELIANPQNFPGTTEFTIRVGSIRRYCDGPSGGASGGMPGYIFQSPVAIATRGRDSNDHRIDDPNPTNTIPGNLVRGGLSTFGGGRVEYINDSNDGKGYSSAVEFGPFELHVSNLEGNSDASDKNFRSSVDLLLLSSVGHLHCQQISGGTDPNFTQKGFYLTASELLGDESLRGRMAQELGNVGVPNVPVLLDIIRPAGPSPVLPADFRYHANPGNLNRFVGRLDFTRFIPRSGSTAMITEAIPLATRVIDAFDTVTADVNVPLIQGRININTAPRRVLEALPYLHPRHAAGPIPARNQNLHIAESLRAYRDRGSFDLQSVDWASGSRATVSNLTVGGSSGLRDDATSRGVSGHVPGFTSAGELLLATRWALVNGGPSYRVDPAVSPSESAYTSGHDGSNLTYEPLDPDGLAVDPGWRTANFDPTDDPSEHLALIRAIRNSVSTRSDVFIAYITLVGFTPDDVRRAEEGGGSTTQKLTRLQASMEQRYMVVFDRSGAKSPSDRPRILFAAQEVPSR